MIYIDYWHLGASSILVDYQQLGATIVVHNQCMLSMSDFALQGSRAQQGAQLVPEVIVGLYPFSTQELYSSAQLVHSMSSTSMFYAYQALAHRSSMVVLTSVFSDIDVNVCNVVDVLCLLGFGTQELYSSAHLVLKIIDILLISTQELSGCAHQCLSSRLNHCSGAQQGAHCSPQHQANKSDANKELERNLVHCCTQSAQRGS